jgi:hypothetical protein
MYCLSEEQVAWIRADILARGVITEDLQDSLLDHVCCLIEQELEADGAFEVFYATNISRFYEKELREIEIETQLLLTFKNYYAMRKAMIISGVLSVAGFVLGSFFKMMYWPGAGPLLMSGVFCFSFLFLPMLCILKVKESKTQGDKLVLIAGTVTGILYCLSMAALVQHWPVRQPIWFFTLGVSFFVFLPAFFLNGIRKTETRMNTMVSTIVLIAAIGIQFMLTAIRPLQPKQGGDQAKTASVKTSRK